MWWRMRPHVSRCVFCPALRADLFGKGKGRGEAPEGGRASAIYFSTRGEAPLADLLAGGDMDGDRFYTLQCRDLLDLCLPGIEAATPAAADAAAAAAAAAPSSLARAATVARPAAQPATRPAARPVARPATQPAASCVAAPLAAGPPLELGPQLEAELLLQMLTTRHEDSVLVGRAEVNHAAAADKFGLDAPLTTELSAVYLEALDAKGDARRHREVI